VVNGIDVGTLLFREILRMNEYPGAPFTGDLMRDLITFFFVPTVFLIAVIFFGVGIVLPPAWRGMRLLFGLAAFLFIVVSGYYPIFAYIAGPYFFVLIVILGLVFFLFRHFRRPRVLHEGGGAPPGPARMPAEAVSERSVIEIRKRLKEIAEELAEKRKELEMLAHTPGGDKAAGIVREEIRDLEKEKYELERLSEPWKRYF